ncbi:MAG: Gfo/Idh/MocA family protein [Promethearchaeota archaeon]
MRKKMKFGIIGCGMISHHLMSAKFIAPIKEMNFIACMDVNGDVARNFAKKYHVKHFYSTVEEILELDELDAVYIAVPHFLHREIATLALNSGKNVFLEKPIATTVDDGLFITKLADKKGLKLGINYQYRYDRTLNVMANAIRDGILGDVYHAYVLVPWLRPVSYFEKSPWHKEWGKSGGGTLITHASHAIDLLTWSLGKPEAISGEYNSKRFKDIGLEVEDNGAGLVKFESGAIALIMGSQATTPGDKNVYFSFSGEKGSIRCTYYYTVNARVKYRGVNKPRMKPPLNGRIALINSFRGYARWLLDEQEYLTTGWEALKALYIVKGIYKSADSGEKIRCNDASWWHSDS